MWQRKMKDMHKKKIEDTSDEDVKYDIFLFVMLQSAVAVVVAGLWKGCFSIKGKQNEGKILSQGIFCC